MACITEKGRWGCLQVQLDSGTQAILPDPSPLLLSMCWPHPRLLLTGFLHVGSGEMGGEGQGMGHGAGKGDGGNLHLSESVYKIPAKYSDGSSSDPQSLWSEGWGTMIEQVWISCPCRRLAESMVQGLRAHRVTWKGESSPPKERGALSSRTGKAS